MLTSYIALGSNLGDRWGNISLGVVRLGRLGRVTPSPLVVETDDESGLGPPYINTVVRLETDSISNSKLPPCNFELVGCGEARLALPPEMLRISSATSMSRIPIPDRINADSMWNWNDPRRILEECLRIELECGRVRPSPKNSPRPLDLDLVAVDGLRGEWEWDSPAGLLCLGPKLTLALPHPRAAARSFVLEPLAALEPGIKL